MYEFRSTNASLTTFVLMIQTFDTVRKAESRRLAKKGLTHEMLAVLHLSITSNGSVIPADISRSICRESQTVSALLNRMEREGLVTRVAKRAGKPFTNIEATDSAYKLCTEGVEEVTDLATEILSCLSADELETLCEMLRKIREQALNQTNQEIVTPHQYLGC